MNQIKNLINDNQLEKAKKEIQILEQRLSEESSKNRQCSLRREIDDLKRLYFEKTKIELTLTRERSITKLEYCQKVEGNKNKFIIENEKDTYIKGGSYIEAKFNGCNRIQTEVISCTGSVLITNDNDSKISCKGSQIRLINCSNTNIRIYTETGVYLQDCKNITIEPLGIVDEKNKYKEVYDFTDPLSKNYMIVE